MNSRASQDEFDWILFGTNVEKLIKFASLATQSPINSDRWEEIIFHTLKVMGLGYEGGDPKWISGSHAPGADLWVDQFALSAKAGQIKKNKIVISSYRLTRFEELAGMIEYIDGPGKNFDYYLCCARIESPAHRKYTIYLIPGDVFAAQELTWREMYSRTSSLVGWTGTNQQGVEVDIRKKMSNQLWIQIPINLCHQLTEISIPNEILGRGLENILVETS